MLDLTPTLSFSKMLLKQHHNHFLILLLFSNLFYLNFSTREETIITDFCLKDDQCNKNSTMFPRPCFCQEDNCGFYKDCCKDVKPNLVYNNQGLKPNCNSSLRYYAVAQCPATWSDDNIHSLCTKNVNTENYHYILDVPFQSEKTKILYSNLYCAMCNQDYTPVNALKTKITCKKNNCSNKSIEEFTYKTGKLEWIYSETNDVARLSYQSNSLRPCGTVIKDCDAEWNDQSVLDQCRDYTNYVQEFSRRRIRNIYCAICNHINISDVFCTTHRKRTPKLGRRPVYTALIDFSTYATDCDSDQIRHETGVCIPFLCGKNYVAENGYCVATDESTNTTDNTSKITCPKSAVSTDQLYILPNGSIFENRTGKLYNTNEYEKVNETTYLLCLYPDDSHLYLTVYPFAQSIVTIICMSLSLISLTIHIIVHITIGNFKKIADKNLVNLSFALFLAQLVFFIGNIIELDKSICYVFAVLSHYFFLVVFFWMNVMAFDICNAITNSKHKSNSKKTFLYYLVYSWLMPLLIVVLSICLDQTNILTNIKPHYGFKMCWISQKFALIVFFALPLAILLIENIIFFSLTAVSIYKTKNLTRKMTKSSDSKRFSLYIKLAFIMGGTWILGFVMNITDLEVISYIYVVANASQGTFVFIVFTLKQRILKKFWNKLLGRKQIFTTTATSTISTDAFSTTKRF